MSAIESKLNEFPEVKIRSERRAARIAQEKIAESAKYLASNKIMATTSLPSPSPPRTKKPKQTIAQTTPQTLTVKSYVRPPPVLPKLPYMVFNPVTGPGSTIQSYMPIPTTFKTPVPIISITASTTPDSESDPLKYTLLTNRCASGSKKKKGGQINTKNLGLIMECEDEDLSPTQWHAYRKAESDYTEMLRKLTLFKNRVDVEIVHVGADEPINPPPKFLTVKEASKLPIPAGEFRSHQLTFFTPSSRVTSESLIGEPRVAPWIGQENVNKPSVTTNSTTTTTATPAVAVKPSISVATKPTTLSYSTSVSQPMRRTYGSPSVAHVVPSISSFPELDVKLVPQKLASPSVLAVKRLELDNTLKTLLKGGGMSLEKWMLEKGLFGATRYCLFHANTQMKLMYMSCVNDEKGKSGYKWWCPTCAVMVPVNQGSFFSKWSRGNGDVLRVIYHWACNADADTVVKEFNRDVEFVSQVYGALRSVCNAQSIHWRLGGNNHSVEIAYVNLGDCNDIASISVYCAYDRVTRLVMLGVTPTLSVRTKLSILFKTFISKESTIVGDRDLFPYLPSHFRLSFVSSTTGQVANLNASSYLKDQVQAVFGARLKKFKMSTIQAILDELCWREKFGHHPYCAFCNILTHIKQAYVCSVVTTKGSNSLPISMATAGVKMVEASRFDTSDPEFHSLGPDAMLSKTTLAEGSESEPCTATASSDEDDSEMPVAADVILEEFPDDVALALDKEEGEEGVVEVEVVDAADVQKASLKKKQTEPPSDAPEAKMAKMSDENNGTLVTATPVSTTSTAERRKIIVPQELLIEAERALKRNTIRASCEEIKISEVISLNSWIPLDSYYYATMNRSDAVNQKQEKKKYKFKCPACKKVIDDNVKMMKHLQGHINDLKQFNLDLSVLTQCNYCYREFASPYAMQSHVEVVHVPEPLSPVCRICDKEFSKKALLIKHMQTQHVPSEMPYRCYICKYRSSFFRDAIQHFQQLHNQTDKLQCNYCLQVFTVRFGQGVNEGVTYGYYRHLYKHQTKSHSRRCANCSLSFLSLGELQQHRVDDHISFKDTKGVKIVPASKKGMTILLDPRSLSPKAGEVEAQAAANEAAAPGHKIEFKCIECKANIYKHNHFIQKMTCSLCQFVTSCSRAYADHAIYVHSDPPRLPPRPFKSMNVSLCCICGFCSNYGDKMAKHLTTCSRSWCYMEMESRFTYSRNRSSGSKVQESNAGTSTETIDESQAEEVGQGVQTEQASSSDNDDKHNMLNVLGLMRVPTLDPQDRRHVHTYAKKTNIPPKNSKPNATAKAADVAEKESVS